MSAKVDPEAVVSLYVQHMRARNLRPWTIYSRQRALARLREWAGRPILHLTEAELTTWQLERSRQIQPEPVRSEMSHHRQFFRWCVLQDLIDRDPTARLVLPRVARRLPRPIPDSRLAEAMLHAPADIRAAIALAAVAGLRVRDRPPGMVGDQHRQAPAYPGRRRQRRPRPGHSPLAGARAGTRLPPPSPRACHPTPGRPSRAKRAAPCLDLRERLPPRHRYHGDVAPVSPPVRHGLLSGVPGHPGSSAVDGSRVPDDDEHVRRSRVGRARRGRPRGRHRRRLRPGPARIEASAASGPARR